MPIPTETVLIVGASRGLGLGLAREYAKRGWQVIGTVRSASPLTGLHGLAAEIGDRVRVEIVDINIPGQVAALRQRLTGERIDVLFVNAGISYGARDAIPETSTEAFTTMMVTNALSPLRVVEAFNDLVPPGGVIAAMSSGLGSVTNTTGTGMEVYRASKAALNTMLRTFAIRTGKERTVLAVAPGWVKTDMGGPNATLTVEESVSGIADAIAARRGRSGAWFVDYQGHDVAW
ncbi:MAG: SDR family NAD(P)-dependent oxidoreductase [Devosia sp.]|nr:SDR family NAD(P)-dependent oxidoreductase [Devosia sp.]